MHPCPVFIGGSPKSGTSVIGALLARATGQAFSKDPFWSVLRDDRGGFLLPDVLEGKLALEDFVGRYRAYFAAGVVKDPDFVFLLAQLQRMFPASAQVFVVRDPRENIRSILSRLRIRGDLEDLGPDERRMLGAEEGWRAVLAGRGLCLDGANYVARLAQRWVQGVESYLAARDTIHLVRYEDFASDRAGSIASLADALGMRLTTDIGDRLEWRHRPHARGGVPTDDFFGQRNLATIDGICAPHLSRFGYGQS
ncbi:MAG TPA: sulfotransferase [Frateuria sp.]|uniref:sulfotransferase family protein n=1 Tax=Frateuria sp. TaxID=2211372 RepID=UPI002D808F38|nr:sulfotransferase [Frateuria sp.]HET6806882.1 sulfotransferase [Frateuria sp.]